MVRSAIVLLLLGGCTREPIPSDAGPRSDVVAPCAPCTDPARCCPAEELICYEGGESLICLCLGLWECPSPERCRKSVPTPPGGGEWSCTWTELEYTCTRAVPGGLPGPNPSTLAHGKGWSCRWAEAAHGWTCTREPPNPCNGPEGAAAWRCAVEGEMLACSRVAP
jgi:hypothetical protein